MPSTSSRLAARQAEHVGGPGDLGLGVGVATLGRSAQELVRPLELAEDDDRMLG